MRENPTFSSLEANLTKIMAVFQTFWPLLRFQYLVTLIEKIAKQRFFPQQPKRKHQEHR